MARNTERENEALNNFLKNCFTDKENIFIQNTADGRSKKYAIAQQSELGGITTLTKFMTYDEMNCFFMGMLTIKENRIQF